MGFHNCFYGSQSQTETLYFCSDFATMKGVEDVGKLVGRNAGSLISDLNKDVISRFARHDNNTSTSPGKLDRIIQEIGKYPPQLCGISVDGRQGGFVFQL